MKKISKIALIVAGSLVALYMSIIAVAIAYKPFRYYLEDVTAEHKEDLEEAHRIEMGVTPEHAAHLKDIARMIRETFNDKLRK